MTDNINGIMRKESQNWRRILFEKCQQFDSQPLIDESSKRSDSGKSSDEDQKIVHKIIYFRETFDDEYEGFSRGKARNSKRTLLKLFPTGSGVRMLTTTFRLLINQVGNFT